jgi:rhodanese-related sulfurtransferase
MGTLQAHLVLALLLRWQPSPLGRLLSFDFRTLHAGGFSFATAKESTAQALSFIAPAQVKSEDVIIDLRSLAEAPQSPFPQALRLQLEALESDAAELPHGRRIVLCCRSGVRAWRAARLLQERGHSELALVALGE